MHYMDTNKTVEEDARRQLHKNAASNIEQYIQLNINEQEKKRQKNLWFA